MKEDKEVLWTGKPSFKRRWAFLQIFGGEGPKAGLQIMPIIFLTTVFGLIYAAYEGKLLTSLFLGFVLLVILFGAEFHKMKRRRLTRYALTNKDVEVTLYWYGNLKTFNVPLSQVSKFYLENYNDDCGIIHIFSDYKIEMSTRNFWSGTERPHITLEDIPNSPVVFDLFQKTLANYRASEFQKIRSS